MDKESKPCISIHTTTQVVTVALFANAVDTLNFNPHHHAGGDDAKLAAIIIRSDFNPHHHAGGDLNNNLRRREQYDFNPHHHAGGDGNG